MFIVETITKEQASGKIKKLYGMIEHEIGFIPPHFRLFATLDPKGLQDFLMQMIYFKKHERIDEKLLPFLRLIIAQKECRGYCTTFNTKLLVDRGVPKEIVNDLENNIDKIPLEASQKVLLSKVLQALFDDFSKKDLQELQELGFSQQDFYDLLNYATNFMAKSKIIDTFLEAKF